MCDERCSGCAADAIAYRVVGPSRRDFIAQATLTAVGALLGSACGDGEIAGVSNNGSVEEPPTTIGTAFTIRIADFSALGQVGGIARVDGNTSNPIAVSRLGTNSFAALSMICPHAGYKPISIRTGGFRCPNHGALFDGTGNWTGGQRTRDLQSYPVVYNAGAGTLTIG